MKKGLSILLIAAALFGFYGGAVNLNDVLACKDYWEEAGKKSTADMNKLEDGLKQLQENEQAYLDGKDQLAEGEKALADGEAQYAQGLADYAAAPGKLAAGEAALAEGEDSYADLKKLISGLKTARKHGVKSTKEHQTYWHDAFSFKGTKDKGYKDAGLQTGRKMIVQTLNSDEMASKVAIIENLAGTEVASLFNVKTYKQFDDACVKAKKILEGVESVLADYISDAQAAYKATAPVAYKHANNLDSAITADELSSAVSAVKALQNSKYDKINGLLGQMADAKINALSGGAIPNWSTALLVGSGGHPELGPQGAVGTAGIFATLFAPEGENSAVVTLQGYDDTLNDVIGTLGAWDGGYNKLAKGQADLASASSGIPFAFKNMTTNKTIKAAIKKYDKKLLKELKKYQGSRLKNEDMDEFDDDLVYICKNLIPRALKVLGKVKGSAESQLADGRRQLAQGRADYAAAPGKLADAERQLADGRAQLAAGKEQLAQYEDGEQQVRDGLATLVGTEPDLELEGILDRLNGDGDFDNGDDHLDIEEGLNAVDVGRGYQADDGVLITDEIMARAVGTGALLGAGVLAVLAAILSFLKKNKGAGVLAILAAAAGAFGAYYGSNAGTYFSDIAGSTAGNAAWVAAGILGAVALVHSIVHFAAKKAA